MSEDKPLFLFAFADYTGWLFDGEKKRDYDPCDYITLHAMCVFLDVWAKRGGPDDHELRQAVGTLFGATSHYFAKNTKYPAYLQSEHWQTIRGQLLRPLMEAREGGKGPIKCPACGNPGKIHIHHKTYENIGRERSHELAPICAQCHMKEHGIE